MTNGPAVLVEGLGKTYPGGVRAVDGIDFEVERGEFFGFLGPNGAGKTTTIKILATLLPKSEGRVEVAGLDVTRDPKAVRQAIGVALQEVGLDDLSKGRDFLELQGLLYGLSRAEARSRAAELLELVGLSSVADRRVGSYSGGMRRRIDLAGALMHNPGVLFLDEPTTGLDPQSRIAVWEHLEELNARGRHDLPDHAAHGRGRPALPSAGDHRPRPPGRGRFAGGTESRRGRRHRARGF